MKKWKILFKPNLRIITQEEDLRKLWELLLPLEVKVQLHKFFETDGCTSNDILLIIYIIQIKVPHSLLSRRNIIFKELSVLLMLEEYYPLWLSGLFFQ